MMEATDEMPDRSSLEKEELADVLADLGRVGGFTSSVNRATDDPNPRGPIDGVRARTDAGVADRR